MAAWGEGLQSRSLFDKSQAPAVIKSRRSNWIWIFETDLDILHGYHVKKRKQK